MLSPWPRSDGEVPERSNGAVSKTVVLLAGDRGFESLPLRHPHTDSRRPKHWIEAIGCVNGSYTRVSQTRGMRLHGSGPVCGGASARRMLPVISGVIDAA